MELANDTGVPAILYRTIIDEDRMAAALIARVTYEIGRDGRLTRADAQPWIVSRAPWEGPGGPMPSDEVFMRGGVDLFVFGRAWAPAGRAVATMPFSVTVGPAFKYELTVTGDRVWTGRGEALRPSAPRPFVTMPLTLAHAFGGKDTWDGLDVAYGDNPEGRGYRLDAAGALGAPLPNLEDPAAPMRRWNDTPEPVGVGVRPLAFGPHLRQAVAFRDDGALEALKPTYFNHAFPRLIVPAVGPGDLVIITGGAPDGPTRLILPPPSLFMELSIGPVAVERPLAVDQIGVELDQRRAFITYRYSFRYQLVPRQRRACALRSRQEEV